MKPFNAIKIVQTFWSGNSELMSHGFGWPSSLDHVKSWALSANLLAKLYDQVELYTDQKGYELLIEKLQLPYTKVHVVLDELNQYSSNVWALSKIRTYSLQDEPFIHVDGDVFLWKHFEERLLESDLVVQNFEIGNAYFDRMWKTLEKELSFIPQEILDYREKSQNLDVYNFGIFGGKDLDFIKAYCKKAFEFVDRNQQDLSKISGVNFNIFFEQYLFYCLAKEQNVSGYFKQSFVADEYKGLANFQDVPEDRSYLHLLGDFKKKEEVCRRMSRRLMVEFPDQYQRVLEVFDLKEQEVFQYSCKAKSKGTKSFSEYYKSVSTHEKFSKTYKALGKEIVRSQDFMQAVQSPNEFAQKIETLNDPGLMQTYQYDLKINSYLSSLDHLDVPSLGKAEYKLTKNFLGFDQSSDDYLIEKVNNIFEIEEFRMPGEDASIFLGEDPTQKYIRLIVPSITAPYFEEVIQGDIEKVILEELDDQPLNIYQIISKLETYFDPEELQKNYSQYETLITNTIQHLVYHKVLNIRKSLV